MKNPKFARGMRNPELVYRELLFRRMEREESRFTQKGLAERLGLPLSTVSHSLKPLRKMNAISVNPMGFSLVNAKKILVYWACIRNPEKEVIYSTRAEKGVGEIEKEMPNGAVFTAYSGYKLKYRDVPADYSVVHIYAAEEVEIKKRFPPVKGEPNVLALRADRLLENYGKTACSAQLFVDLWNQREWYAADFLKALEEKIYAILE